MSLFHDDELELMELAEIGLLREILKSVRHIERMLAYPRLSSFDLQARRKRHMPTPGPITLTSAGQQVQTVVANPKDQFGAPWTGEVPAFISVVDDNPTAATTDASGLVTAVANGTDNVTAQLSNSAGTVITGTPLQFIVDIPVEVPVLSSFDLQAA